MSNEAWISRVCEFCGRDLDEVWVQDGFDPIEGGPRYELHMRCPKKITSAWQYYLFGDKHYETVVFPEDPPNPAIGDPGRLSLAVWWS